MRVALLALALALVGTGDAGGAEWRSRGSGLRLRLVGYGQLDGRFLVGWRASEGVEPSAESDLDVGRLRFGVSGEWSRLSAEVEADVVDPDPLKDAWLGVRFSRALRLRVGHQKLPLSGEWMTSARRTDFLRRALPVEALAPGRDWGVELHGELSRLEYEAGVFAGDGWKAGTRSGTTLVGRLVFEPLHGLRLGGSAAAGSVEAAPVVDGVAGQAARPRGGLGVGLHLLRAEVRRRKALASRCGGELGARAGVPQRRVPGAARRAPRPGAAARGPAGGARARPHGLGHVAARRRAEEVAGARRAPCPARAGRGRDRRARRRRALGRRRRRRGLQRRRQPLAPPAGERPARVHGRGVVVAGRLGTADDRRRGRALRRPARRPGRPAAAATRRCSRGCSSSCHEGHEGGPRRRAAGCSPRSPPAGAAGGRAGTPAEPTRADTHAVGDSPASPAPPCSTPRGCTRCAW